MSRVYSFPLPVLTGACTTIISDKRGFSLACRRPNVARNYLEQLPTATHPRDQVDSTRTNEILEFFFGWGTGERVCPGQLLWLHNNHVDV